MFTPAAWIRSVPWPTIVTRKPATLCSGRVGRTGTVAGQRSAPRASFHLRTWNSDRP